MNPTLESDKNESLQVITRHKNRGTSLLLNRVREMAFLRSFKVLDWEMSRGVENLRVVGLLSTDYSSDHTFVECGSCRRWQLHQFPLYGAGNEELPGKIFTLHLCC
jgi:hypothetical protein